MRLILPLLLMALAVPAWADWVKHGDLGELATFYYDPTTIKKKDNMVRVWVYTELGAQLDGERSSRALYEIDCKDWRRRTLQRTSFSGPMMSGEIVGENAAGRWNDASDSTLLKIICPAPPPRQ
jgi:Surface-adhesin protein E